MESGGDQGPTNDSGWGTMGGTPGEGIPGMITDSPPYSKPVIPTGPPPQQPPPPIPMYGSGYAPASMQQQPQYNMAPPPPAAPVPGVVGGSITRFAPPEPPQPILQQAAPTSFAARSQQMYGSSYPQQQPPPQEGSGSFAARSQMAHVTQAQQHQQAFGGGIGSSGMYSATSSITSLQTPIYGSQQQTQQQQPAQPVSYAARSQQQQITTASYQQPQQPLPPQQQQQPSYSQQQQQVYGVGATQQQPSAAAAGSYAARSAQALYGSTPQQQPYGSSTTQQPQLQPQLGQQQAQQQPSYGQQQQQPYRQQQQQPYGQAPPGGGIIRAQETPQALAMQQHLLTEATRKVQEHAYYMRQAMEQQNLPIVLDRAAHMVGELGGPPHGQQHQQQPPPPPNNPNQPMGQTSGSGPANTGGSAKLTPKNYYELYMRVLEELPTFEDYLLNLAGNNSNNPSSIMPSDHIRIIDTSVPSVVPKKYTMSELYDCVQYCPRVVSRLYLQISAGSALLRIGDVGAKFVMKDLQDAVKCEQNPIRGLFLRHYLLTALRDKLPTTPEDGSSGVTATVRNDTGSAAGENKTSIVEEATVDPEREVGTVKDSYEFILANFMEMNKLWVRIQHLPGEGKNKDVRKRRERERNDLRILVGTNLVRLSQLESVTSQIYGEIILPRILEHIVVAGDPLSQAYLMDCLVQVFPDEYHIETLPILLNVCPRLRDKVNIRTILQGLMDRLANYLADEELLDESDTNEVKKTLARDSFGMFEECVQSVYNARGPKLTSKEVIRLQTALLQFSIKCYRGNMEQVGRCISACVSALRQANASYEFRGGTVVEVPKIVMLDDVAVVELEKFLSIPLDTLALRVLQLHDYGGLIGFLPWVHRREVAMKMLTAAVATTESVPASVREVDELFGVIEPLIRDEYPIFANPNQIPTNQMAGLHVSQPVHQIYQSTAFGNTDMDGNCPYSSDQLIKIREENALISKLIHLLSENMNPSVVSEMLLVAKRRIIGAGGGRYRIGQTLVAIVFASLRLCRRTFHASTKNSSDQSSQNHPGDTQKSGSQAPIPSDQTETQSTDKSSADTKTNDVPGDPEAEKNVASVEEALDLLTQKSGASDLFVDSAAANSNTTHSADFTRESDPAKAETVTCRQVFVIIQETIAELIKYHSEMGVKLYLDVSLAADSFAQTAEVGTVPQDTDYRAIAFEFLSQAFTAYEERIVDPKIQYRCLVSMVGTLMSSKSITKENYESLITKTAQGSAKIVKKQDQCHLVALCAHLFYPIGSCASTEEMKYSNPQRALECLQRCLKLADACTTANPAHVKLFVDTLEHYIFFFEKKNPVVTHAYISGLVALIKEHLNSLGGSESLTEAKSQFLEVVRYITKKKNETELFAQVNLG